MKLDENWKQENGLYKCPECGVEKVKNGICSHILFKHKGLNGKGFKGKVSWSKGLTEKTSEKVKKRAETLRDRLSKGIIIIKGHSHSEEFKKKQSIRAKERNLGGHTSKKKIYYEKKNGEVIFLQSSYEIVVADNLEQNNISWSRPSPLNWIDENNIEHRYYADFYLNDYNVYLDPKNDYLIKKDEIKINSVRKQNNVKLIILNKEQLNWKEINALVV